MGDFLSLSLLQVISLVSFITSILAVVRVGSVSFNRLSQHKFAADVPQPESDYNAHASLKLPSWNINWSLSGLPASFSLGTLLGEDESQPELDEKGGIGHGGYTGGADLCRMDWQLNRSRTRAFSLSWSCAYL